MVTLLEVFKYAKLPSSLVLILDELCAYLLVPRVSGEKALKENEIFLLLIWLNDRIKDPTEIPTSVFL